jgi:glycosyltransferase involved in cell wall biosynthesis
LRLPALLVQFGGMPIDAPPGKMTRTVARQRFFMKLIAQTIDRNGVAFAANSAAARDAWAAAAGCPTERIAVIPNGVTLEPAAPDAGRKLRAQLGIPEGAPVFGGVMRLAAIKDPNLWIETVAVLARLLPDAHFLLVGDGPFWNSIARRVAALTLADRVHMPGLVTAGLSAYYAAMDVVMLTSLSESLPNTLLEAQLAGRLVVTTDAGGAREAIVRPDAAGIVASRTPEDIARAALELYSNAPARSLARDVVPQLVRERFSIERMVERSLAVYERILSRN